MAKRTKEQMDADDSLTEAVNDVIAAYGLMPDTALVQDFTVVIEAMEFNQEEVADPTERMAMVFKDNYIRTNVLIGMLDWAKRDAVAQQDESEDGFVDG